MLLLCKRGRALSSRGGDVCRKYAQSRCARRDAALRMAAEKTYKFQTFPLYKMQKIHLNAKECLHFAPDSATMQITKAIA